MRHALVTTIGIEQI